MSGELKKVFIKDINIGADVVEFFLVRSKNKLTTKAGKPYLDLELQDKTGIVTAKMWDDVDRVDDLFGRGDIIKIKAAAQSYRDQLQIKIEDLRAPTNSELETLDIMEFLPSTPKDVEAMHDALIVYIESVENEYLAEMLRAFWEEDNFRKEFVRAPAARNIHHAYLGGLLEHTLNVTVLADAVTKVYPELDRDILITMAILHDVGKMKELSASAEIVYTRSGLLLGHISLGLEMINEKIRSIMGFPEELAARCKHIILSHHGELEFGSPIVPKTPEAIVLHYLDNLDAKTNLFINAIANDKNLTEEFTTFNRVMGRNFYKGILEEAEGENVE